MSARVGLRTVAGPAPLHTPPLILLGPPGIAKSSWARDLARIFAVPSVDIDVGATNGATFSVSGVERGWGSAAPGRVVRTMLRERLANPLVILDEVDKIPDQVATSRGSMLPGAFEVLKSMIEPTTARAWVCPFFQIPFNLTGGVEVRKSLAARKRPPVRQAGSAMVWPGAGRMHCAIALIKARGVKYCPAASQSPAG